MGIPTTKGPGDDIALIAEYIHSLLEYVTESLEKIKDKVDNIANMMEKFNQPREEKTKTKTTLDKEEQQLQELEKRVEALDQQAKLNDVIVTGLRIKQRDTQSVEKQVTEFLTSKDIHVDFTNNLDACHLLPWRNNTGTRAILLTFLGRKHKVDLLRQGKKLKGSGVFINENLTKKNADIARKARQLKKSGKIQHTWTANCRIYIKTNGSTPEETKTMQIRSVEELEKYDQ